MARPATTRVDTDWRATPPTWRTRARHRRTGCPPCRTDATNSAANAATPTTRGTNERSSVYTAARMTTATRSSTTQTVSRKTPARSGTSRPSNASRPSESAVSVDIATAHPWALECPALTARKSTRARPSRPARPRGAAGTSGAPRRSPRSKLAARLQADDEEEQGHQPAVDPGPQVVVTLHVAEADREGRVPEALVARVVEVGPDQGGHGCRQQDAGASGLGRPGTRAPALPVARPGRGARAEGGAVSHGVGDGSASGCRRCRGPVPRFGGRSRAA